MNKEYMKEEEVAEYLKLSTKTLQKWRYSKTGPPHLEPKPRMIRYKKQDVINWLNEGNR